MNEMANRIGKEHLLKKSVLMIKAWLTYEGSLMGSYAACMATYGLYVLVLHVINNYYDELYTPMDVFKKFFQIWGTFDFDSYLVSIYGPVYAHGFYDKLKNEVNSIHSHLIYSVTLIWTDLSCSKETLTQTTRTDLC